MTARRAMAPVALAGFVLLAGCGESGATDPVLIRGGFSAPIVGTPMENVFYGAYFDHDPAEGAGDYACGIKAYDGHRGVDVLLRNFAVQDSGVAVVAAADGIVESIADGMPDRNTAWDLSLGFGNHVVIVHPDGDRSIYAHLRRNSLEVSPGQDVDRGDRLGLVGSSGRSNWPHLHFEVRRNGVAVDPFTGSCAPGRSLWAQQLPYQDELLVTDAGSTEDMDLTLAVLLERPATVEAFPMDTERFRFWLQVANQRAGVVVFELRAPGGAPAQEFTYTPGATFSMTYLILTVQVSGSLTEPGDWEIRTYHDGEPSWTQPFTLLEEEGAPVVAAEGAAPPLHGGEAEPPARKRTPFVGFEVLHQARH